MKFSAWISMVDPSFYVPMARTAEEAGFDLVGVPESIVFPRDSAAKYPWTADGSRSFLDKPAVLPLTAMAAMGAATSRIEFQPGVIKVPMRHPVMLAKELSSLSALIGGRLRLGAGTSPWPYDYEVMDVPWEGRHRRFAECLQIVRGLTGGEFFEFHGEFYDFAAIKMAPPAPEPIPIVVGGHSKPKMRQAVELADGCMPEGVPPEELPARISMLHDLCRKVGRPIESFEIHAGTADSGTADGVKRLEELGVTHTSGGASKYNIYSTGPDPETLEDKLDALKRYGDEVIAKVRG